MNNSHNHCFSHFVRIIVFLQANKIHCSMLTYLRLSEVYCAWKPWCYFNLCRQMWFSKYGQICFPIFILSIIDSKCLTCIHVLPLLLMNIKHIHEKKSWTFMNFLSPSNSISVYILQRVDFLLLCLLYYSVILDIFQIVFSNTIKILSIKMWLSFFYHTELSCVVIH